MESLEKKVPVHFFEKGVGDSYEDVFLDFFNLKKLKKGDVFYECHFKSGKNYELKLKENPVPVDSGVECVVENLSGDEMRIYVSGNTEYRNFNLFKIPQNLTEIEKNKFVYIIS